MRFCIHKKAIAETQVNTLIGQARSLFQPNVEGTILEQRYHNAIQNEPAIALMHIEISKLLGIERVYLVCLVRSGL